MKKIAKAIKNFLRGYTDADLNSALEKVYAKDNYPGKFVEVTLNLDQWVVLNSFKTHGDS